MFRPYTPKDNVQKRAYYNDRFWVAPKVERLDPFSDDFFAFVTHRFKNELEIEDAYIELKQLVIWVKHTDNKRALTLAKELEFDVLNEMSAIDYLAKKGGFEIFYQLLSLKRAKRIRIKCFLPQGVAIESVESLYKSANFQEREMFDMFGIYVNNHSNLKRILLPDDWQGHPLLKSYPLQGDEFAKWYEIDKIFGKEYRNIIGPENRDAAYIDRYNTKEFARIGHEVPFGADISSGEPETPIRYQEEKRPFLIEKFDPKTQKVLEKRK